MSVNHSPNVQSELDRKAEAARQAQLRREAAAGIRPIFNADDVDLSDGDVARIEQVFKEARQRAARIAAAKARPQAPRRAFGSLMTNF